jgi:hypothetical protein
MNKWTKISLSRSIVKKRPIILAQLASASPEQSSIVEYPDLTMEW